MNDSIEVYIVEPGEPRSREPVTTITSNRSPQAGDVLLPYGLVGAPKEATIGMGFVPFRVIDRTHLYVERDDRPRLKMWIHVRRMTPDEYDATPR